MRMIIDSDEWWPVWSLEEYTERTPWEKERDLYRQIVEVDDELRNRADKAKAEFQAVQKILHELEQSATPG